MTTAVASRAHDWNVATRDLDNHERAERRAWVRDVNATECAAQGLAVDVTDPVALDKVATILSTPAVSSSASDLAPVPASEDSGAAEATAGISVNGIAAASGEATSRSTTEKASEPSRLRASGSL